MSTAKATKALKSATKKLKTAEKRVKASGRGRKSARSSGATARSGKRTKGIGLSLAKGMGGKTVARGHVDGETDLSGSDFLCSLQLNESLPAGSILKKIRLEPSSLDMSSTRFQLLSRNWTQWRNIPGKHPFGIRFHTAVPTITAGSLGIYIQEDPDDLEFENATLTERLRILFATKDDVDRPVWQDFNAGVPWPKGLTTLYIDPRSERELKSFATVYLVITAAITPGGGSTYPLGLGQVTIDWSVRFLRPTLTANTAGSAKASRKFQLPSAPDVDLLQAVPLINIDKENLDKGASDLVEQLKCYEADGESLTGGYSPAVGDPLPNMYSSGISELVKGLAMKEASDTYGRPVMAVQNTGSAGLNVNFLSKMTSFLAANPNVLLEARHAKAGKPYPRSKRLNRVVAKPKSTDKMALPPVLPFWPLALATPTDTVLEYERILFGMETSCISERETTASADLGRCCSDFGALYGTDDVVIIDRVDKDMSSDAMAISSAAGIPTIDPATPGISFTSPMKFQKDLYQIGATFSGSFANPCTYAHVRTPTWAADFGVLPYQVQRSYTVYMPPGSMVAFSPYLYSAKTTSAPPLTADESPFAETFGWADYVGADTVAVDGVVPNVLFTYELDVEAVESLAPASSTSTLPTSRRLKGISPSQSRRDALKAFKDSKTSSKFVT
jgi:hypothetical protein